MTTWIRYTVYYAKNFVYEDAKVKAKVWWTGKVWAIKTPYDRIFVEDFKLQFDRGVRSWDPEVKVWTLEAGYEEKLKKLLVKYFREYEWVEKVEKKLATINGGVYQEFLSLCPPSAIKKLYRDSCVALHPDKPGGDANKMAALNAAWAQLKQTLEV